MVLPPKASTSSSPIGSGDSLWHGSQVLAFLHVEYAERRIQLGILFTFSLFGEYSHVEHVHIHVTCRVNQAEYVIRIPVAVPQEYVKQSTGHTHTGHIDRENTPDIGKPLTRTQSESEKRHNDA